MIGGEYMFVIVRTGNLPNVAGADFLSTYNDRNVDHQFRLAFQFLFKCDTLWRTSQISFHRLVGRYGECDNGIVHDDCI